MYKIMLLFLLSTQAICSSLVFKKNDKTHKIYQLKELKTNGEKLVELEINNVWRKYKKVYVGRNFYKLLDEVYGPSWRKGRMISFKALDGYVQTTKISLMIKKSIGKTGLIAISEKGKMGFSSFSRAEKKIDPGPLYLVWSNFKEKEKASHGDILKWPYQLKEINISF